MMVTFGIKEDPPLVALQGGYSTPCQTRAPEGAIPSRAASMRGSQKTPSEGEIWAEEETTMRVTRTPAGTWWTGPQRGSDGAFTAAAFIKYAAIVIVVLVIAYVVL